MLFLELNKFLVNKVTFVGFTWDDRPSCIRPCQKGHQEQLQSVSRLLCLEMGPQQQL